MRLVELECRNHHTGTPILLSVRPDAPLGAYCAACRIWIKWVPKTERWLALQESQTYTRKGHTNPPDVTTAPEIAGSAATTPVQGPGPLPDFHTYAQLEFSAAISAIAKFCNDQAVAMGFLDRERSLGDMLTLINTEMSELFEAHRKGTSNDPSEHIPEYTQSEEEWADIGVRWFCHAVENGVDPHRLGRAFVAKLLFNRTRGYRHGGKVV